jgi:hypothetical protein
MANATSGRTGTVKIILLITAFVSGLLVVQTLTFLYLAPAQLKGMLLEEPLGKEILHHDSIVVRDYYTTDCRVGEAYVVDHKINLARDSTLLKSKFRARKIKFATPGKSDWSDSSIWKYPVAYEVSARSRDWKSLYGFYAYRVEEVISLNKRRPRKFIIKERLYRWVFFCWKEMAY